MARVPTKNRLKRSIRYRLTASSSSYLAARRTRERAWLYNGNVRKTNVKFSGDASLDLTDDLFDFVSLALCSDCNAPIGLEDNAETFHAILDQRKRRAPVGMYEGRFTFDNQLNVLRVDFAPTDNDHVLQSARDKELTIKSEPQIPGSKKSVSGLLRQ